MVHRRHRKQGGDGRPCLIGPPVAQHQDGGAFSNRPSRCRLQAIEALAQAPGPRRKQRVHARAGEPLEAIAKDRRELPVAEHRTVKLDLAAMPRTRREEIALRPEQSAQGHHQRLADGIDGRIGHLGEELLEIGVEQLGSFAQHRERAVVAHRAERLLALRRHRREEQAKILPRVAVQSLDGRARVIPECTVRARGLLVLLPRVEIAYPHQVGCEPVPIGLGGGEIRLELAVFEDALPLRIDDDHPSRRQPTEPADSLRRNVHRPRLGCDDYQVVGGDGEPRRAESVAIQARPDLFAVAEGDEGGSVPGLHERRVIAIEGAHLRRHVPVTLPGLRHHHRQRVGERAAGVSQELQDIVEHPGIAAFFVDHRQHLHKVRPEFGRIKEVLAGAKRIQVPTQGVDLTVVGDESVGVGALPTREGIGAETLVRDRKRARNGFLPEIGIEAIDLPGQQQPLVDDGPG